jgi:hypothetical protein
MMSHHNAIHGRRVVECVGDSFEAAHPDDRGGTLEYSPGRFLSPTCSRSFLRMARRAKWIVLGFVALESIGAAGILVFAVRYANLADDEFFHSRTSQSSTFGRIDERSRPWFATWDGFRTVRPDTVRNTLAKRASFDFPAAPRRISARPPEAFSAIRPFWPCNPVDADVPVFDPELEDSCPPE